MLCLAVLLKPGVDVLIAMVGNGNQLLAFGGTLGGQADPGVRIFCLRALE